MVLPRPRALVGPDRHIVVHAALASGALLVHLAPARYALLVQLAPDRGPFPLLLERARLIFKPALARSALLLHLALAKQLVPLLLHLCPLLGPCLGRHSRPDLHRAALNTLEFASDDNIVIRFLIISQIPKGSLDS